MPSALPEGQPAPSSGLLPESAGRGAQTRGFALYVHIPFCSVRCGYCDFNTYTHADMPGVSHADYPELAQREIGFAAAVLDQSEIPRRSLTSVFFGGGTPSVLPPHAIPQMLNVATETWGLVEGAEVSVEANPDSVSHEHLAAWAQAGVTRVSIGVQSWAPHVLATLDRTHTPESVAPAVGAARSAGLQVSMDLIYGTPGESIADWTDTLERSLELEPDHLSAYSLIIEPGTALARRVARGDLSEIDPDVHAQCYEVADHFLGQAGYQWYEVSNWSRTPQAQSRHNLSYWRGDDWWGVGPGAHSHVGGVRWWNVKHPAAWASRLTTGDSPAQGREVVSDRDRWVESVMLGLRLREGIARDLVFRATEALESALGAGWIEPGAWDDGRLVLTLRGRLMADRLALELTEA